MLVALASFALSPIARGQDGAVGASKNGNTAEGTNALHSLGGKATGTNNTAMGFDALLSNTNGIANTANGSGALQSNTTGDYNTAVGYQSLYSNTIAGRYTFDVGWQGNTATGYQSLYSNTTGEGNVASGFWALYSNTTGIINTATGRIALYSNTTGVRNTATGDAALTSNTTGSRNTATGHGTLQGNTTGGSNTANGRFALYNNTTGSFNIALGEWAGFNLATGDNNIDIGNFGVAAESNTIRIGLPVAATNGDGIALPAHTATYIAGIYGATTSDAASTTPVVIDMNGNLGTAASSERFKRDVKPMDKSSDVILALKPVTFHYKNDSKDTPQFGLIAEDVAKANPNLVVRDAKGDIYTVRYEAVNAMLLNEFLKEHKKVEEQATTIAEQRKEFQASITKLEATVAQQQNGMEVLSANLKEQASQIQKVSAQINVAKPAPQVVDNNQ